ncbi:unnamed protein product [Aspergillus oryzae]|uniref:Unnamed protein product n=2 Tax=Aspergillus oryzae TaxID=5062 RepID=A0AAN4YJR5_ASPOZ|nr:unnamed protein product [Aspergillus oryzae]GMF92552.1 unnamed protein product [Aspergillus oryzae]GMG03185.1 unnamed protein product [Aspergillus oryzae]GMG28976.1 unnamed protein product [Aspergillus oryzae]GMG46277.1 unnamed protein product [Aspergillus oryzae var. brunneus]
MYKIGNDDLDWANDTSADRALSTSSYKYYSKAPAYNSDNVATYLRPNVSDQRPKCKLGCRVGEQEGCAGPENFNH